MCSGRRRGRAALRQRLQNEVYEHTLPPGPLKRPRRRGEDSFHRMVAEYLQKALPPEYEHTCFPAGGGGFYRGAWLKKKGLKKGIPDHMVMKPGSQLLWIELKAPYGRVDPEQKLMHGRLRSLGHTVVVCFDLTEVELALDAFCYPDQLRARAILGESVTEKEKKRKKKKATPPTPPFRG
jgi:hypothetical protein